MPRPSCYNSRQIARKLIICSYATVMKRNLKRLVPATHIPFRCNGMNRRRIAIPLITSNHYFNGSLCFPLSYLTWSAMSQWRLRRTLKPIQFTFLRIVFYYLARFWLIRLADIREFSDDYVTIEGICPIMAMEMVPNESLIQTSSLAFPLSYPELSR